MFAMDSKDLACEYHAIAYNTTTRTLAYKETPPTQTHHNTLPLPFPMRCFWCFTLWDHSLCQVICIDGGLYNVNDKDVKAKNSTYLPHIHRHLQHYLTLLDRFPCLFCILSLLVTWRIASICKVGPQNQH